MGDPTFNAMRSLIWTLCETIEDLLKQGEHDGPCDNEDEEDERACTLHLKRAEERKERAHRILQIARSLYPIFPGETL